MACCDVNVALHVQCICIDVKWRVVMKMWLCTYIVYVLKLSGVCCNVNVALHVQFICIEVKWRML